MRLRRRVTLTAGIFLLFFPGSLLHGKPSRVKFPIHFEPEGDAIVVRGLRAGARIEPGASMLLSLPQARSFSLQFMGANRRAAVEPSELLPGCTHYFIGRDSRKWRTNVPQYGRVRYRDVYPGIDVVYYGVSGSLEYDFIVKPGADPRRIRIAISGAGAVRTEGGDLVIEAAGRWLRHARPRIYQETPQGRVEIAGRYAIDGAGHVHIDLDRYDSSKTLVIDPLIVYSTLLGGDDEDDIRAMAVDGQGNVYVTGSAGSNNFPGSTSPNTKTRTQYAPDAYVAKINAAGTALVFAAFFGSLSGNDIGTGIALDPAGNIYVTGSTTSADFPVSANAVQTKLNLTDAFLLKLDPSGSKILYSTLVGGSRHDYPEGLAVTPAGHAVVAGHTNSRDFPRVASVASPAGGASDSDAFVFRLDTGTGKLVYSSVFGGAETDEAYAVALDGSGNAYVTGTTRSKEFPVSANAFQGVFRGSANSFIVKLNAAGNSFVYSTLLGGASTGSTTNAGNAIAVDAAGNAYIVGTTDSQDFPTTALLIPKRAIAGTDAFVAKLNPDGSALLYSSPIGGSGFDYGFGVAVTSSGEAWVTGTVFASFDSPDFPTVNPTQWAWGGGFHDWFLCKVNAAGTALTFSTFIGGSGDEGELNPHRHGGVALDQAGNVYVAGQTMSGDFPATAGVLQARYGGYSTAAENAGDTFIVRIDPLQDPAPVVVTPQDRVITTVAGGGTLGAAISGPATQAAIGDITAMALHPSGSVLFASKGCGGGTIIGGQVVPGSCESGPIRSVSPDGWLRVVAGSISGVFGSGDGGPAEKAVLDISSALAVDAAGNIYIAEASGSFAHNRVWKVGTDGIIHRIVGTGTYGYAGDGGPARDAQLAMPAGLAVDRLGSLYIADGGNGRIRKVAPDGTIVTIAGGGTAVGSAAEGVPATQVRIDDPTGIVVDDAGNVYFLERPYGVGQTLRKVTPNGLITTIAGTSSYGFNGDARPAVGARLRRSAALAIAPNGEIYIADTGNNRIRRIDREGMIWNIAGTLGAGSSGDNGPGELAQLDGPIGIAFDRDGNLYIAESHRIRKLAVPRPLPKFDTAGVVTAAGNRPGVTIARGSIFTVYGTGIGPAAPLATPGYPLGAWLSDVTIKVTQGTETRNAIPLYVSSGQINAIMPSDTPLGDVQMQVLYAGFPSAPASVKVLPVNFQFFTGDDNSGLFQNVESATNYVLNSLASPAHPGQTVIGWGSGMGAGSGSDSLAPQGISLPVDVEVLVGGKAAQVTYKGRAPGFAGVDNLYMVIPADALTGCRVPVQVRAGGVSSAEVTIAISTAGPCQ